jgi:hypothetical protein
LPAQGASFVAVATARQARKQKEPPGTHQLLILFDIPPTNINDKYKSRLDAASRNRIFAQPNTFAHGIGCRDLLLTILFYKPPRTAAFGTMSEGEKYEVLEKIGMLSGRTGRSIY